MQRRSNLKTSLIAIVALTLLASPVSAFFPTGGVSQIDGVFRKAAWRLDWMDLNRDGDITYPDEGVAITFESGDNGWDTEDLVIVREGFKTWQDVSTSYAGFYYTPGVQESLELDAGLGAVDFYNFVAVANADEDDQSSAVGGALVNVFVTFVVDEITQTGNDGVERVFLPGQIVDADAVYTADQFDQQIWSPDVALGTSVIGAGYMLGLGATFLDNIDESASEALGTNIDPAVVRMPGRDGVLRLTGVTPSMTPTLNTTPTSFGLLDHASDLAYDDIAGITYLYPRGDTSAFFSVRAEARDHAGPGYGAEAIAGGIITAWCDTDNNPDTPRVPMYNQMGGYYEYDNELRGYFNLINMTKTLADSFGATFNATYTFTHNGIENPEDYDYSHEAGGRFNLRTLFASEVYREDGNITDWDRHDEGTPFYYDESTKAVTSVDSGKKLSALLALRTPMFGDGASPCISSEILPDTSKGAAGITALRSFRDKTLLNSAVGAAVAETYYRISPYARQALSGHPTLARLLKRIGVVFSWVILNPKACFWLLVGFAALVWFGTRARARKTVTTMLVLAIIFGFFAVSAHAKVMPRAPEDMVAESDVIIAGTVVDVRTHWNAEGNKILTDITFSNDEVVKGMLNKGGLISVQQIGGQIDGFVTRSSAGATFEEGEGVVLFLKDTSAMGLQVWGGKQGKCDVTTDEETGEKVVSATSVPAKAVFDKAAKEIRKARAQKAGADDEAPVTLDEFLGYLRGIVRAQK